jgi:hypothetical protein
MDVQLYVYDLSKVSFLLYISMKDSNRKHRVWREWYVHSHD